MESMQLLGKFSVFCRFIKTKSKTEPLSTQVIHYRWLAAVVVQYCSELIIPIVHSQLAIIHHCDNCDKYDFPKYHAISSTMVNQPFFTICTTSPGFNHSNHLIATTSPGLERSRLRLRQVLRVPTVGSMVAIQIPWIPWPSAAVARQGPACCCAGVRAGGCPPPRRPQDEVAVAFLRDNHWEYYWWWHYPKIMVIPTRLTIDG